MPLAAPSLPAHHPQNIPLSKWTDGWLTLSVAGHTDVTYLTANDTERREKEWPVTREEKIAFLVEKGEVPAAGINGTDA